MSDVASFGPSEAERKEMSRIKALFKKRDGDAEDLITYAREIVGLRSELALLVEDIHETAIAGRRKL